MPNLLQVLLLPTNFESNGMTSHKQGLAAKIVSRRPPTSFLSRQISYYSGHFSGRNLGEWKRQKSNLCWVTFESVPRHAFRKREIDVNKGFAEVQKLTLVKLLSLLSCSLVYTTAERPSDLRIHTILPCSVTLKIGFIAGEFSLDNSKDLTSLIISV